MRVIAIHNDIISLENKALTEWVQIHQFYHQRALLDFSVLMNHKAFPSRHMDSLQQIDDARKKLIGTPLDSNLLRLPKNLLRYQKKQARYRDGIEFIRQIVSEQYALQKSASIQNYLSDVSNLEDSLLQKHQSLHQAIETFNNLRKQTPHRWLISFLDTEPLLDWPSPISPDGPLNISPDTLTSHQNMNNL